MRSQVAIAVADGASNPISPRRPSFQRRVTRRLLAWLSPRPNEPWVCVFLNRALYAMNVVFLLATVLICTQQNQLVANTPKRSWAWPWASCFDANCPTEECCSQFLFDEWSFKHFSHGYILYYWLLCVPVRNLLLPLLGIFVEPTDFDYIGLNLCILLEVMWEAYENHPSILAQSTTEVSLGDSGLNVLGDVLAGAFGFTVMHMAWMYCFDHSGFKIPFLLAMFYSLAMTMVLYIWFCDGFVLMNMRQIRRKETCGPRFPDVSCGLALSIIGFTIVVPLYAKHAFKYELDSEVMEEAESPAVEQDQGRSPEEQGRLPEEQGRSSEQSASSAAA